MASLVGNLQGLKPSQLKSLERLASRRTDRARLIGYDLARDLGELAWQLRRNVGVLLDRAGHVRRVLVGDMHGVELPADLGAAPQPGRLRGERLIRTDLRGQIEIRDADRNLLVRHRLDALVRLELDEVGEVLWVRHAFLDPARIDTDAREHRLVTEAPPKRLSGLADDYLESIAALEEEISRRALGLHRQGAGERALLVGVHDGSRAQAETRMAELGDLARSALFEVVGQTLQKRDRPDPRTLIGRGKVAEIARLAVKYGAQDLIVDRELTGMQQRNLEDHVGLAVIDRTDLVLRIFERRAHTRAARLRVALARMRYQLPRLAVRDHGLSRIGRSGAAGQGTRGKGERRIDLDRRRMRDRIRRLESLLERVAKQQATRRKQRELAGLPICSLVGYTNAGKSSWLHALTGAEAFAEDLLFATLDTCVRRTRLPSGMPVLLADTVGFLRELPKGLYDAFRSTLEEVTRSDLLVHVVDVAAPDAEEQEEAVLATLTELGASSIPRLTLYNKADLVDRESWEPIASRRGAFLVSVHDRDDRLAVRARLDAALLEVRPQARRLFLGDSGPE